MTLAVFLGILAAERVPEKTWMTFTDPAQAGFDAAKLEAARKKWESIPSSAFMVVADGAVVAAWGDVERRFMCHSVRKSFMSALYGIYWDLRKIDLNKTMGDLGIDDEPNPLLPVEKQARILDLLKARSGIFHPAAYAGRTDSAPRGSKGPGRYFAYNNWDFNTLVTILEQETGDKVFESFDRYFGKPLKMEDWRVSDGYYHYERDKSKHPAYPFRMSARDAARFGLLFARDGLWGDNQILSRHWVRRSTALYSDDNPVFGYGMLWWVARQPRFEKVGLVTALGVGNQAIAAMPAIDLVVVNRANTYKGEGTPMGQLMDLVKDILDARTGSPVSDPHLVPLKPQSPDPRERIIKDKKLMKYAGKWPLPAPPLGMPKQGELELKVQKGTLVMTHPFRGTFALYLQKNGTFFMEDGELIIYPVHDKRGNFAGLANINELATGVMTALGQDQPERARQIYHIMKNDQDIQVRVIGPLLDFFDGKKSQAEKNLSALAKEPGKARPVESNINAAGYFMVRKGKNDAARALFEMNTRLFPNAFNTWDSLAEIHMNLGNKSLAIKYYKKSLALNPQNRNGAAMLKKLEEKKQ